MKSLPLLRLAIIATLLATLCSCSVGDMDNVEPSADYQITGSVTLSPSNVVVPALWVDLTYQLVYTASDKGSEAVRSYYTDGVRTSAEGVFRSEVTLFPVDRVVITTDQFVDSHGVTYATEAVVHNFTAQSYTTPYETCKGLCAQRIDVVLVPVIER